MKVFKYINRIFSVALDIVFVLLLLGVYQLGLIPAKYLVIFSLLIIILSILFTFLSFKLKKMLLSIILFIFMLLFSILSLVSIYYVRTTNSFFDTLTEVKEKQMYYVVVKKDSDYSNLKDLNNKSMAIFENQSENYNNALNKVKNDIKVKEKKYTNMNTIVKDLFNGNIDSLLINSNVKKILDENIMAFKENTKIIAKFSINIDKQENKDSEINNSSFNILISGIDTYGNINNVSRSDINIIMTVNPNVHKILLTSVQRDMYVQLHGTTGLKDKLTHAGLYGINMSIQTIEDFLDIDIPYYIRVNFDSAAKLIDSIGGVDIYNDIAFKGYSSFFAKGDIHLNGEQTVDYSRARKQLPNGDWTRGEHQKVVITAIINKIANSKELLLNYGDILNSTKDVVQTNVPTDLIKQLVKNQLSTMSPWNITSTFVGGAGSDYRETYSMPGMNLYITYPDENSVKNVSKQINDLLNEK